MLIRGGGRRTEEVPADVRVVGDICRRSSSQAYVGREEVLKSVARLSTAPLYWCSCCSNDSSGSIVCTLLSRVGARAAQMIYLARWHGHVCLMLINLTVAAIRKVLPFHERFLKVTCKVMSNVGAMLQTGRCESG